jgi:hypothetical protein
VQVLSPNDVKLFKNLAEASPEKLMRMLNRIVADMIILLIQEIIYTLLEIFRLDW